MPSMPWKDPRESAVIMAKIILALVGAFVLTVFVIIVLPFGNFSPRTLGRAIQAGVFYTAWALLGFKLLFGEYVPLTMVFGDDLLNEDRSEDVTTNPTDELRERYVAGELSETEFERAVEHELEDDEDCSLSSSSERETRSDREREPSA